MNSYLRCRQSNFSDMMLGRNSNWNKERVTSGVKMQYCDYCLSRFENLMRQVGATPHKEAECKMMLWTMVLKETLEEVSCAAGSQISQPKMSA